MSPSPPECLIVQNIPKAKSVVSLDVREATISGLHQSLLCKETTCREIARAHLARIMALDGTINSVVCFNPKVLDEADALDRELVANDNSITQQQRLLRRHRLFGIPVLFKDNYDVAGMPTTGGCLALRDSYPPKDAAVVQALKSAGALIVGKTNTHEFALEGLTVSSLGGQTANPYDLTRTPGGSSGGSGAALAASFAVIATGSDTMNSLRSPASANAVCSCRPSRGLISRAGIMPVSSTQDVVGPMARTVRDVAVALGVMLLAPDHGRASLKGGPGSVDLASLLDAADGKLSGVRLGLVHGFLARDGSTEGEQVNDAMRGAVAVFQELGASIVQITDVTTFDSDKIRQTLDTQRWEFRESIDEYLRERQTAEGTPGPTSLQRLLSGEAAEKNFLVIPSQYDFIEHVLRSSTADAEYARVKRGIDALATRLAKTFAQEHVDALIYPQQKQLVVERGAASQTGRNGILAALTGCPVVAVPMSYSKQASDAPRGVPIGMEILGQAGTEARLLQIAHAFEQSAQQRRPPASTDAVVDSSSILVTEAVPVKTPDTSNISSQYPLGRTSSGSKP